MYRFYFCFLAVSAAKTSNAKSMTAEVYLTYPGNIHWGLAMIFSICISSVTASSRMPAAKAQPATVSKYIIAILRLKTFQIVAIVAAFVAGPVIKNTSAAPGVSPPWKIIAAATGTEALEQT